MLCTVSQIHLSSSTSICRSCRLCCLLCVAQTPHGHFSAPGAYLVGRRAGCFGRGDRNWHLLLLFCFLPPVILHLPPMVLHSQWLHREALVQATSLLGRRWGRMKWAPDWTPLQGPTFSLTKLLSLSPWPPWCVEQSPFRGWPWFEGSFFHSTSTSADSGQVLLP